MAIWQFEMFILPEEQVHSGYNDRSEISWEGKSITESSKGKLEDILIRTKSWSDEIEQYGSSDGTCMEIFHDGNQVMDIHARLNLRNLTKTELLGIIDFIKENKAAILSDNGEAIPLHLVDIMAEIKKSRAYKFVRNPHGNLTDK
ncbi:hypothetical protein PWEIH_14841 [Listeria weihenstephanensis FSL R9-0317]|uniref:Uncharacterized protein n=1 Tax=Listeria weihenstephanensis TaxID=1006155 RepID=A0A1S7FVQ9_9LIST|nr:hypothetical protein [Listeria weihenstephanensis]AQY51472.1 hypothetical protein UE46_10775 [Listeria weihenstephanensis]EUJ35830.1 hypothetical protein PWEIH_14841 [Listeria weihenstephanensis FSL R9-0317]